MQRTPSRSFFRPLTKLDGNTIHGQIGNVIQETNVRSFILPRRYLLTAPDEKISAGDILDLQSRKYMVLDYAEKNTEKTKVFKLCQADKFVKWYRQDIAVDLVTGLSRDNGLKVLGEFWVCWEFEDLVFDPDNRKNSKIRVLCNAPIQPQDRLGDNVIHMVEPLEGVYYAELT